MKISIEDGELLIDVYSRFLFRVWGILFIATGLIFLFPMLVQYSISCEEKGLKHANICTLNTSFFKIYSKDTYLGELKSATVSNFVEGRANSIYYCLLLNTSEGYIKVPNIRSKRNIDIVYVADAVDSYINESDKKNISIPKVESVWSYFKVLIFPFIGFSSLLFRLITIKFSKKTNTITIAAKNIINTHETIISIDDVAKLILEEHGKHHKEYSLALILKNGEEIHLPGVHDSSMAHIEEIAREIKPFLKNY
ncbi:hypothetical protein BN59_02329 [Legionella massiliensis]|uniref:Uncharacterized protein n=1 Tax=Legionella massiliensis TaxID=1034943 RepID=A0A078KYA3_9GAMM|nr:hypothetical protein [Legionella massiliensis]CDZ78032.1 hypothetical protein BN59_02329 [Legionella massiliensis]CEE13770.1 hypothetical protein BN1094_02329 [Legionella massiliensis]